MKPATLLCIASYLITGIAGAAEAPVVDITPSTNTLQQSQQRTDFALKEWQRATQQVSAAENAALEEERNVQRLTQQLEDAKRRLDVAKRSWEMTKLKEKQFRAKWELESSGLRPAVSKPGL